MRIKYSIYPIVLLRKRIIGLTIPIIIIATFYIITAANNAEGSKSDDINLTIAFGSCSHQDLPQPVLNMISDIRPDLFIYLGDNIYNDSYRIRDLRSCYKRLADKPEFRRLKSSTNILATWDDHDYGWNDSGKEYPYKKISKKIFLEFFGIPDPDILKHRGIYHSRILNAGSRTIQIIMLDVRTFRDRLLPYNGNRKGDSRFDYVMDYSPHRSTKPTMLGKDQWAWLEKQLIKKADLRVIASSTQFAVTHNGYEAWANFPHEQQRMIDLIKKTRAEGVIFISGDVHYAELSMIRSGGIYPLYDVTSSGITSFWDFFTPNDNRIEGPVMENNFGILTFNGNSSDPVITIRIQDVNGDIRINRSIRLSSLTFDDKGN